MSANSECFVLLLQFSIVLSWCVGCVPSSLFCWDHDLCGICLELIQWLHSTCKYMININLLTHFESSSCHGFTLYIVILCNTTMLTWTHTFWAHLMVAQPILFPALKCHWGNVANPKPLRPASSIWLALPLQLSNLPKTFKNRLSTCQQFGVWTCDFP